MGTGEAVKRSLIFLLLLACDRADTPAREMREFVDVRGERVRFAWPPRRIVSIVPSSTELLYAVGAGDQVVGVTTYCDFPPEAKEKAKVGAMVVDMERIVALNPDLVVTTERMTKQATAELERRGIPVFSVDPMSFEAIEEALRKLGAVTDNEEEGRRAAASLRARVEAVALEGEGPTFYFEHSADPLGTTGPESYAGDALRRAGGRNIFDGGWRLVEWEAVLARDPEVILVAHERREALERRVGWKELQAVRNGHVYFIAKEGVLFPTPRLVDGLEAAYRIFAGAKR